MLQFIINVLIALRILNEPSADNALKTINKILAKLEIAAKHQVAKAEKMAAAATAAAAAAMRAEDEAQRARNATVNLSSLFDTPAK